MRFVRISLLCFVAVLMLSGITYSQTHIGCDQLTKSSEVLRLPYLTQAKPGDTVLMPVSLQNDSVVTAFQFLIEFDTTWLTPVFIKDTICSAVDSLGNCTEYSIDSNYVDHTINGRFVALDSTEGQYGWEYDTVTNFSANLFQNRQNVIAGNFLPEIYNIDTLINGSGAIYSLKFIVDPTMPHGEETEFTFYEHDIVVYDTVDGIPESTFYNGCHGSQMTEMWTVQEDSSNSYQIYPTTDLPFSYLFRADTGYTPSPDPTVTLSANPTNITSGSSSTLSWGSTNADSVFVRNSGGTKLNSGQISGSVSVSPTTTSTYTATAYGNGLTATANATVTVGTVENVPVVVVTGNLGTYQAGDLISITVTATNAGGSQITLTPTASLPSGASFGSGGSVVGNTPVTGTLSWTPSLAQEGYYNIQFSGTDGVGTGYATASFNVEAPDYDQLFSTSTPDNRPVGGLPGARGVAFPIDLISTQTVYGIQFDMLYPSSEIRVDSFMTTARIPDYVVYDNIGVTPGEIRVVTFGLGNEPVVDTTFTAILEAYLTLDSNTVPWEDHWILLENGRETIDPDPNVGSLPLITDSGVVQVDRLGDVNTDKYIDVADPVSIVSYIIGTFGLTSRQFAAADIMENDSVNVFDLVADINLIFGIEPTTSPSPTVPGGEAVMMLAYSDLPQGSSDVLTVASELPELVAGVQCVLNYDPTAVSFEKPRLIEGYNKNDYLLMSSDDDNGRLVLVLAYMDPYNPDRSDLQAGLVDLVEIPMTARTDVTAGDKTMIRLTEALLSTPDGAPLAVSGVDGPILPVNFSLSQNYPNPFNPTTTIEFYVGNSEDGAASQNVRLDVFNILGQSVRELINSTMASGQRYEVMWDATNNGGQRVASGVYFYRLEVGDDYTETKKMLFLK